VVPINPYGGRERTIGEHPKSFARFIPSCSISDASASSPRFSRMKCGLTGSDHRLFRQQGTHSRAFAVDELFTM